MPSLQTTLLGARAVSPTTRVPPAQEIKGALVGAVNGSVAALARARPVDLPALLDARNITIEADGASTRIRFGGVVAHLATLFLAAERPAHAEHTLQAMAPSLHVPDGLRIDRVELGSRNELQLLCSSQSAGGASETRRVQDLAAEFLRETFSVPGERASVHPAMISVRLADVERKRDPALERALSPAEKAAPGYIATATVNVGEAQYRGVRVLLLERGAHITAKRLV